MWNWFNCYLSGRHEYGVWCEPGSVYLRCMHCGKRSGGWDLAPKPVAIGAPQRVTRPAQAPRVLPFERKAS